MKKIIISGMVAGVLAGSIPLSACGNIFNSLDGKWVVYSYDETDASKARHESSKNDSNYVSLFSDFAGALGIVYMFNEGSVVEFDNEKMYVKAQSFDYSTNGNKIEFDNYSGGNGSTVMEYSVKGDELELVYDNSYIIYLVKEEKYNDYLASTETVSKGLESVDFVGHWDVSTLEAGDEVLDIKELYSVIGTDSSAAGLDIKDDSTISLNIYGESDSTEGTWRMSGDNSIILTVDGDDQEAYIADGTLIMSYSEGGEKLTMTFTKSY